MSGVITVPRGIGERTGGRTHIGYEELLEKLTTESTMWDRSMVPWCVFPSSLSPRVSVNELVQALLKVVEVVLQPEDPRRLELYESLVESLSQRMVNYPQSTATGGTAVEISLESEVESYYASYYERHEYPETINAFLSMLRSIPVAREERTCVYTDEELEAFS